ncbi:MAG: hypothetical protein JXR20_05760 [Balneola sp.]
MSAFSVAYHAQHHLTEKLVTAIQESEQDHAGDILSGMRELQIRAKQILDEADEKGQKRVALEAIRELRSLYELGSKIAIKLAEYQSNNQSKKTSILDDQLAKGIKALSDNELHTLIMLTAKVHAADPDYPIDSASQMIVESYGPDAMQEKEPPVGRTIKKKNSKPTPRQDQINPERDGSGLDLEWEDLEDLELESLDGETIPSSKTDPKWLRDDRRRHHR